MSNTDRGKADTIAHHFYTKLCCVVHDARSTQPSSNARPDKWFNLETTSVSESELFSRETQRLYKNISDITPPGPPPLEVQVLLMVPELANNQALVYLSPENQRIRIEPTPNVVVLETWTLALHPHSGDENISLPTIYKHGIPLFRSLYSLLRILPAWKFQKRLRRTTMTIQVKLAPESESQTSAGRTLSLEQRPSPTHTTPLPTATHTFPPVPHPLGSLVLSGTYLSSPNFQIDELESLLSSRFISLDHQGFVPTLVKNQQRDSITGSSLPTSTTRQPPSGGSGLAHALLSRSPPKSVTRAVSSGGGMNATGPNQGHQGSGSRDYDIERFILPSRVQAPASIGSSASTGTSALIPPPRPFPSTTTTTLPQNNPSPSGLNSTHARIPRESLNSSASSSLTRDALPPLATGGGPPSLSSSPSSASGVPIRRPSINPVPNLFKSNTVAAASAASVAASVSGIGTSAGSISASPSLSIRLGGVGAGPLVGGISGSPLSQGLAYPSHSRQTSASASPASVISTRGAPHTAQAQTHNVPPSPVGGFQGGGVPSSVGDRDPAYHHRRPGSGSDNRDRLERRTSVSSNASVGLGIATAGADPDDPTAGPRRKRYSSSFGNSKYTAAAAAAAVGNDATPGIDGTSLPGTTGLSGLSGRTTPALADKERDVPASPTQPSRTDDAPPTEDDINVFVQDIDLAKPLSGRAREQREQLQQHGRPSPLSGLTAQPDRVERYHHERYRTDATDSTDSTIRPSHFRHYSASGTTSPSVPSPLSPSRGLPPSTTSSPTTFAYPSPGRSGSPARAPAAPADPNLAEGAAASTSPTRVVKSQGEADERLRVMNENFLKSLEGMGGGIPKKTSTPSLAGPSTSGPPAPSAPQTDSSDDYVRRSPLSATNPTSVTSPLSHYAHLYDPSSGNGSGSGSPMGRRQASSTSTASLGSVAGSTTATGAIGSSQGSEEVIGKMELYPHDNDGSSGSPNLSRRGSRR